MVAAKDQAAHLDVRVSKLSIVGRSAALITWGKQRNIRRVVLQLVGPPVPVVLEIRIEKARVDVRPVADAVVGASGKTVPRAEVLVLPEAHAIEPSRTIILVGHRLDVVDAAAFPVEGASNDEAEFLAGSEPAAESGGLSRIAAAALDWRVTAQASDFNRGCVSRRLGDEVHRSANAVTFHIRLQGFADLDGLNKAGRDGVELDLAHAGLFGGQVDAVHGGVGEPGLRAANLHVFAFTLVSLERNAWQAP